MSHAYDERCAHCRIERCLDAIRATRPYVYPTIRRIVMGR